MIAHMLPLQDQGKQKEREWKTSTQYKKKKVVKRNGRNLWSNFELMRTMEWNLAPRAEWFWCEADLSLCGREGQTEKRCQNKRRRDCAQHSCFHPFCRLMFKRFERDERSERSLLWENWAERELPGDLRNRRKSQAQIESRQQKHETCMWHWWNRWNSLISVNIATTSQWDGGLQSEFLVSFVFHFYCFTLSLTSLKEKNTFTKDQKMRQYCLWCNPT